MKLYYFLLTTFLVPCSNGDKEPEHNIAGEYVRYYEDEYSMRYDTLAIHILTGGTNGLYQVEKRSSSQKTWEKTALPEKRESRRWNSEYLPQTASLPLQPGLTLYFDVNNEEAILGSQRYKKLNLKR
jgi:hypothetical protein